MKKARKYRWNTQTRSKQSVDALDEAIDRISKKQWVNTYQTKWAEDYAKTKDWERLRVAIRAEARGYMEVNDMSAQEAVNALRRSRFYTSQEDFYKDSVYRNIVKEGWNRDEKGRFALKKANLTYQGKIEYNGTTYTQYKAVLNNGVVFYTYEAESPKDPNYRFFRSYEDYGE